MNDTLLCRGQIAFPPSPARPSRTWLRGALTGGIAIVELIRTTRRLLRDMAPVRAAGVRLAGPWRSLRASPDGLRFLVYHGMRPEDRAAFERQLRMMRDIADLISASEALALLAEERVSGRQICLTFDDGCRTAYDFAVPILQSHQVPAAFFVVPGWIDAGHPAAFGWDECRNLAAAGLEIGSHSLTHARLSTLAENKARAEATESLARIQAELGRPCLHFACPWGQPDEDYWTDRDPDLVKAAGYRSFFTTVQRRASAGADPWALPRISMEPGWGAAELRYALYR